LWTVQGCHFAYSRFQYSAHHPSLHPFPARCSSDLGAAPSPHAPSTASLPPAADRLPAVGERSDHPPRETAPAPCGSLLATPTVWPAPFQALRRPPAPLGGRFRGSPPGGRTEPPSFGPLPGSCWPAPLAPTPTKPERDSPVCATAAAAPHPAGTLSCPSRGPHSVDGEK